MPAHDMLKKRMQRFLMITDYTLAYARYRQDCLENRNKKSSVTVSSASSILQFFLNDITTN